MKQHWNGSRSTVSADPTGLGLLPGDMPVRDPLADPLADPPVDALAAFPDADHPELARLGNRPARQQVQQPAAASPVLGSACAPEDMQAALAALVQLLRTVPVVPAGASRRRVKVSARRITETMTLIQECGLTPTGIAHRPDGTTVIEIGHQNAVEKPYTPEGWPI